MDKLYWSSFYRNHKAHDECSPFALFMLKNYLKASDTLLELGCGNGRDSLHFAKQGIFVTAIDQVDEEIHYLHTLSQQLALKSQVKFIAGDFTQLERLHITQQYNCIYSRFTLHSISKKEQDSLLHDCLHRMILGGVLAIEVRGEKNSLYQKGEIVKNDEQAYIYDGHYRRFLNFELTLKELSALREIGTQHEYALSILEANEDRGFAPFNGEDDYFIRIIAQKVRV